MGRFVVAFSSIYLLFVLRFKFFFTFYRHYSSVLSCPFFSLFFIFTTHYDFSHSISRCVSLVSVHFDPCNYNTLVTIDTTHTHENNSFEDRNAKMKMHKLLFLDFLFFLAFVLLLLLLLLFLLLLRMIGLSNRG